VALGFVEGLNNKIRVLQRRAFGLRDEEYLRLKVLTCMLPELRKRQLLPTRSGEEPKDEMKIGCADSEGNPGK
jgi:hypothetical protein